MHLQDVVNSCVYMFSSIISIYGIGFSSFGNILSSYPELFTPCDMTDLDANK
jgi:hypothetical protein